MKRLAIVVTVSALLCMSLLSQWKMKEAFARKIDDPITIDGHIDEESWGTAPLVTNFIQFEPKKGLPATLKTEVRILYDDRFIYFAFRCLDPEPENIASRITSRDEDLKNDDSVAVFIDTFHDRRTCYFFETNLLGTQFDGRITDNGRTEDITWDGIWKSAGRLTDNGWNAEMRLELSSLKFAPGEGKNWGINFARVVPRHLENSLWNGPLESPNKVSQFGVLRGLDLEKSEKKAQIIPHVISKFEENRESDVEAGIDVRYAFSQMVSGNLTVNPDFATVEADEEQINLTRFELDLPEKRNFFLEGSEIYKQRIRLFYTRRISDIYGGLKIYGKSGRYEFSGLSTQTKKNEATDEESANFSIFRLKRDVMQSSTVGFLAANKLVDGKNTGTAGIDTALYFSDTFKFTGQFALSYGDYNNNNLAFFLRPSYDSSTFHIHLRYTHLGKHFGDNANEVGFIRDDNRHELDSDIVKTFWLKKGGIDRIYYFSNYNIYWGVNGTLRSWKIHEEVSVDFQNKITVGAKHIQDYQLFEKGFRNYQTTLVFSYNAREWQNGGFLYNFGRNFDLKFHLFSGGFNYKLTQDFSLTYGLTRLIFDPDPRGESTWIHGFRATNYFTNDLFIKVFFQTNSSIDKKNTQIVFVYRFQPPFGSIQIAYQRGTGRFGEKGIQGHTLFIKFAYMF